MIIQEKLLKKNIILPSRVYLDYFVILNMIKDCIIAKSVIVYLDQIKNQKKYIFHHVQTKKMFYL